MRVLLIHNPKAGDGKHGKKQLMASLTRYGHHALYQSIKERGWKKVLKKPVDLVIAAGGDGTVQKTAWEIMGSDVPLAIFPLGTANNLARSFGFTASIHEIAQSLDCAKRAPFDIGVGRNGSQCRYFLEAAGGGLFADYFPAAAARKKERASAEEELAAHVSFLRDLALDYPARHWKMNIDGEHISGRFILWGAMNIRSAGPALHLASAAATDDGRLDFVAVREEDRDLIVKYLDARLAGRKADVALKPRRFRQLKITGRHRAMHLDGKAWPTRKENANRRRTVEIPVKSAALIIWRPRAVTRMRRETAI
jgi:diacylglycerol kinase (ATP)